MTDKRPSDTGHLKTRLVAILCSLGVGTLLMAGKFWAYRLTGSSAIFSDALESIINVVASGFALYSIFLAAKPPDASHPYGHGKIEYFSAGFEGALIILAALGIFKTGVERILHPMALVKLDEGLALLLAASIINLGLGIGLVKAGRRTESLTLVADGKHVITDFYTSAGVLLGLVLVRFTGWLWLDGTVACLVGLNIVATGARLVQESYAGLMDASDPELLTDVARLLVSCRRPAWIDVHQLRAWRAGNFVHLDLHLILPRDYSLEQAHGEAKILEANLVDHFQGKASALIHLDPCIDPDCPVCSRSVCRWRMQDLSKRIAWNPETLTRQSGAGLQREDFVKYPEQQR
jgi:cation diffusion facilitator family transporter